jgi:hypothetical protein
MIQVVSTAAEREKLIYECLVPELLDVRLLLSGYS